MLLGIVWNLTFSLSEYNTLFSSTAKPSWPCTSGSRNQKHGVQTFLADPFHRTPLEGSDNGEHLPKTCNGCTWGSVYWQLLSLGKSRLSRNRFSPHRRDIRKTFACKHSCSFQAAQIQNHHLLPSSDTLSTCPKWWMGLWIIHPVVSCFWHHHKRHKITFVG